MSTIKRTGTESPLTSRMIRLCLRTTCGLAIRTRYRQRINSADARATHAQLHVRRAFLHCTATSRCSPTAHLPHLPHPACPARCRFSSESRTAMAPVRTTTSLSCYSTSTSLLFASRRSRARSILIAAHRKTSVAFILSFIHHAEEGDTGSSFKPGHRQLFCYASTLLSTSYQSFVRHHFALSPICIPSQNIP